MFTVYANTPGYLPEDDDPFTTEDETEARTILADMIERDWDSEYESAESESEREDIDARYIEAHAAVNTLKVPGAVYVSAPEWQIHGLGRVYSIASE